MVTQDYLRTTIRSVAAKSSAFIVQKYLGIKPLPRNISRWLYAVPIVLIVVAFIIGLFSFMERYDVRDFTAYERQLTQFRALMAYLYNSFAPTPGTKPSQIPLLSQRALSG